MSSWLETYASVVVMFGICAAAGCTNDGSASATQAPVPGDLGTPATSAESSAELLGPRADPSTRREPRARMKGAAKEPPPIDPAKMDPSTFVPKDYCLMPKLSICSVYGDKYERIASVTQFCAALGGERAGSCPDQGRVARCITPANVITSYYSSGEKPYTKETAEAKCNEKNWPVLP